MAIIDRRGFRSNVGIIIVNADKKVLWAKRKGQEAWQFPQGGMHPGETLEQTLFRELDEEVGLKVADVDIIGVTERWLYYRLPQDLIRYHSRPLCIGQKQKWFLLKLVTDDAHICLEQPGHKAEFDDWCWVPYWYPVKHVIAFKKNVYIKALKNFEPLVLDDKSC